jgi:phage shock protein B
MDETIIPILAIAILFLALPWMILHYVTKWKTRTSLTSEDESMLDDLYDLARRLDDRMQTLERILHDENPSWNPIGGGDRHPPLLEERSELAQIETELKARRSNRPNLTKRERA